MLEKARVSSLVPRQETGYLPQHEGGDRSSYSRIYTERPQVIREEMRCENGPRYEHTLCSNFRDRVQGREFRLQPLFQQP